MTLSLRQIEVIRAVVRAGTVTEAASQLAVSQPAVSRVLKLAEDRLGLALFERRGGRLHPSPELRTLFPEIERLYEDLDTVLRAAADLQALRSGRVSLVAIPAIATTVLATAIASFTREQPDLRIQLRSALNYEIPDLVAENRAEIGFGFDLGESPDLVSIQLGLSALVCVCPEGHALARRETVSPADILPYRLISFSRSLAIGEAIDAAFTDSGHARRFSVDVGQSFTACALVVAGAGVTIVDSLTASTWRQPGIAVRPFAPSRPLRLSAVFPAQRRLSLAATALLESMIPVPNGA